jgi:hypothetical protein
MSSAFGMSKVAGIVFGGSGEFSLSKIGSFELSFFGDRVFFLES